MYELIYKFAAWKTEFVHNPSFYLFKIDVGCYRRVNILNLAQFSTKRFHFLCNLSMFIIRSLKHLIHAAAIQRKGKQNLIAIYKDLPCGIS